MPDLSKLIAATKAYASASRAYNRDCNLRFGIGSDPDAKHKALQKAADVSFRRLTQVITNLSAPKPTDEKL